MFFGSFVICLGQGGGRKAAPLLHHQLFFTHTHCVGWVVQRVVHMLCTFALLDCMYVVLDRAIHPQIHSLSREHSPVLSLLQGG